MEGGGQDTPRGMQDKFEGLQNDEKKSKTEKKNFTTKSFAYFFRLSDSPSSAFLLIYFFKTLTSI